MTSVEPDAAIDRGNGVFISYRRGTSSMLVEALYQRLTKAGIDAFYDIESIGAGRFEDFILDEIRTRPYFVLVLQAGSLDRSMEAGDWMTKEMECALESGATLIPLYTEDFDLATIPDQLPRGLGERVLEYQGVELPMRFFRYVVQELVDDLVPLEVEPHVMSTAQHQELDRIREFAQTREPVSEKRLRARELISRGKLKEERGDLSGAIGDYDLAIGIDPDDALAHRSRSSAQLMREGEVGTAPTIVSPWGPGWRSTWRAVLSALGIAERREDPLGCTFGRRAYRNSKLASQLVNARRPRRALGNKTQGMLRELFPELDVASIRYRSRCRLPSSAYESGSSVYAVTFGNMVYWRGELDEDDPQDLVRLIHEVVHIDQMRRFGGEHAYACAYGEGYLAGGGALPSFLRMPTAFHRNPLEAEAYSFESRFRNDLGHALPDRLPRNVGCD